MRSSSRNSGTPFRALTAAAVSLLLGSVTQAADQPQKFVFTAFSNGRGGQALVSGHFEEAAAELRRAPLSALALQRGMASNNRCIALSMTRQWDLAHAACDAAVRDAQLEHTELSPYNIYGRNLEDEYVALALANRAVLHWISSESAAAESDLRKAQHLAPKSAFVTRNLTALHAPHPAVAQVTVASQATGKN